MYGCACQTGLNVKLFERERKLPIAIPAGVTVTVSPENVVTVKGPKGELSQAVDPHVRFPGWYSSFLPNFCWSVPGSPDSFQTVRKALCFLHR